MPAKRAILRTLGCRLNQAETFLLRDKLAAAGYSIADENDAHEPSAPAGEPQTLVIINTCAVTQLAAAKCRQVIRQLAGENPRAFVAVVGCYSQLAAAELAAIPGVDLVLGNQNKLSVLEYVGTGAKFDKPLIVRERVSRDDFTISFAGDRPFNKRANLKIQDGCNFVCSFCIIPKARGPARSRDLANLIEEARALARRGVRELVLTGVNIGCYNTAGSDTAGNNIVHVVDALAEVAGIDRLRLGSIEPTTVPDALLLRMADPAHPLLPHLHLPLQSGSERILRDMRRRYSTSEYAEFARHAAVCVNNIAIGTDVMIGFPGETDDEFAETCAFLDALPLAYAHVFTYSERDGAPAARRADAVPVPVRQQRSIALRRTAAGIRHRFLQAHLGQTMRVLFEDPDGSDAPGLTDNYIRVIVRNPAGSGAAGAAALANRTALVRLERINSDFIEGTLTGNSSQ